MDIDTEIAQLETDFQALTGQFENNKALIEEKFASLPATEDRAEIMKEIQEQNETINRSFVEDHPERVFPYSFSDYSNDPGYIPDGGWYLADQLRESSMEQIGDISEKYGIDRDQMAYRFFTNPGDGIQWLDRFNSEDVQHIADGLVTNDNYTQEQALEAANSRVSAMRDEINEVIDATQTRMNTYVESVAVLRDLVPRENAIDFENGELKLDASAQEKIHSLLPNILTESQLSDVAEGAAFNEDAYYQVSNTFSLTDRLVLTTSYIQTEQRLLAAELESNPDNAGLLERAKHLEQVRDNLPHRDIEEYSNDEGMER